MTNKNMHISICGIGPGHPDYISKIVYNEVEKAAVLIGGKRQLEIFAKSKIESYVFDGKTATLKKQIEGYEGKYIVVLVSGDTGFYSLARFIGNNFPSDMISMHPGISTYQYFFARMKMGYEKASLASMHGTEADYIEMLKSYKTVFLLTDRKNNYKTIAQHLIQNDFGHCRMHIGSNLSYEDEIIISDQVNNLIDLEDDFPLCSVIIEPPM